MSENPLTTRFRRHLHSVEAPQIQSATTDSRVCGERRAVLKESEPARTQSALRAEASPARRIAHARSRSYSRMSQCDGNRLWRNGLRAGCRAKRAGSQRAGDKRTSPRDERIPRTSTVVQHVQLGIVVVAAVLLMNQRRLLRRHASNEIVEAAESHQARRDHDRGHSPSCFHPYAAEMSLIVPLRT